MAVYQELMQRIFCIQVGKSYIFTMMSLMELTELPLLGAEQKRTLQKSTRKKPCTFRSEI